MQMRDLIFLVKPLSCSPGEQTDKINDADIMKHTAVHGKVKDSLTLCRRLLYPLYLFDIIKKVRLLGDNHVAQDSGSLADNL